MKNHRRWLAGLLCMTMVAGTLLTGCGGSGQTEESDGSASTEFSFTIATPDTGWEFDTWSDSPAVQEWLKDCGEDITIDWNEVPASSDTDFYATLLATNEYTDIMQMSFLPETAAQLYEEGVALDLTELVEENMPNYLAWVEEHPQYRNQIYKNIDGEDRIINIYPLSETTEPWSAWLYRRDWILEYGTNPTTGEAFTGGWQDEEKTVWEDDIVFPSGETYPLTISDWEWMFDIFEKALEGEGITDGYVMQLVYRGYYMGQGNLLTSFGGTYCGWQEDSDGNIEYGWTDDSDAAYAYTECLNHWYEEGWIDQGFDERASEPVFYMIDSPTVYDGKVGLIYGGIDFELGNMLGANHPSDYNADMCYMAAPQPINDEYGPESVQNVDPWHYFEAGSLLGSTSIIITNKAEDKDIAALLRAIDYTYGSEGEALSTIGISDEQQKESNYEVLNTLGLENGIYTVTTNEDGEKIYQMDADQSDLATEVSLSRLGFGLNPNSRIDKNESQLRKDALSLAVKYAGGGDVSYITDVLPSDQASEMSTVDTQVTTLLDTTIPEFITGRTELNEENWAEFQQELKDIGVDKITQYIRDAQ